jgi:hypothetical protein
MKGIPALVVLVVLAGAIALQFPEIKRYLKIRRM